MERPKATLKIIEWEFKIDSKKLPLCNDAGFSYYDMPARVQAPGIDYTAYLCSPEVDGWFESGSFTTAEMNDWKSACKRDPRRGVKIGIENGPTAVFSVG